MELLPRPSNAPVWAYDSIILPCWQANAVDRILWGELGISVSELIVKNPFPRSAILAGYGRAVVKSHTTDPPVDFAKEVARMRESGDLDPAADDGVDSEECIPREIPRAHIELLGQVGRGQFGEVWKAVLSENGNIPSMVAVKQAWSLEEHEGDARLGVHIRDFMREAIVMASISPHINVVSVVGVVTAGVPLMLLVSYCEHGSLLSYLKDQLAQSEPVLSRTKLSMALSIAKGMAHLSAAHVVHRDLAARNVLVDSDFVCAS